MLCSCAYMYVHMTSSVRPRPNHTHVPQSLLQTPEEMQRVLPAPCWHMSHTPSSAGRLLPNGRRPVC